jgi:hypothetical protein
MSGCVEHVFVLFWGGVERQFPRDWTMSVTVTKACRELCWVRAPKPKCEMEVSSVYFEDPGH